MARLFADRREAGLALADRLGPLDPAHTVIFALPRGGVPVAIEVAKRSGAPLDLLLVRKIGAPGYEELAIGAVVDGAEPEVVVNRDVADQFGLSEADVRRMSAAGLAEIERRRAVYLEGRAPLPVKGKTAIVVDDGIATGASMRAALQALRNRQPARIVLAVPVAPADVLVALRGAADEIVCLEVPHPFAAVGAHYRDFRQVDDAEVVAALQALGQAPATKQSF
ncbi:phosphoribosyltransferase [Devosia sp.]|uniref:phosphoribosyltransferase n=1 Tax=Devosia sp. TaxID=1871048 RepID=UPI002735F823|nr:phosphoribosyltransferase family protein [Devosia sp.]MDP2781362.1 phosphoribosyltransferase family protein [Devosia sp.]